MNKIIWAVIALFCVLGVSAIDTFPVNSSIDIVKMCLIDDLPCGLNASCNISFVKANGSSYFGQMAFGQFDPSTYNIVNYSFNHTETNFETIKYVASCCDLGSCNAQENSFMIRSGWIGFNVCPTQTYYMWTLIIAAIAALILILIALFFKIGLIMIFTGIGMIFVSISIIMCDVWVGSLVLIFALAIIGKGLLMRLL